MPTTIEANTATSIPQTTSATEPTNSEIVAKRASSPTMEDVISNLAESLMGYASKSVPESSRHQRLFARVERLVNSITHLIEALAKYRKSSNDVDSSATKVSTTSSAASSASTDDTSATAASNGDKTAEPTATTASTSAETSETGDSSGSTETAAPSPSTPTEESQPLDSDKPVVTTKPMPIGTLLPATRGFLWKAVSDKNGKLAVLIPKKFTGKVKQVRILDPKGTKELAKGKYSGVGNGDREHYRFTKPGGEYPDGAIVVIELKNGETHHVKIKETSKRLER